MVSANHLDTGQHIGLRESVCHVTSHWSVPAGVHGFELLNKPIPIKYSWDNRAIRFYRCKIYIKAKMGSVSSHSFFYLFKNLRVAYTSPIYGRHFTLKNLFC